TRRLLRRVQLDQVRHPVDTGVLPAAGERRMADLFGTERPAHHPDGVPDDLPQLFAAVLHLRLLLPGTGLPLVPALVLDTDGADERTAQRPGALSVISGDHLDSRWCETQRLECRYDRERCRARGTGTAEP